jgi:hypothetical protein
MQEYPAGQAPPGPPSRGLVLVKCGREHRRDIALTSPHPSQVSDMAKKRDRQKQRDAEVQAPPAAARQRDGVGLIRFGGQVS